MSPLLNVIALISGGKDSLYSVLHCVQNGHNVIALANLHPPPAPTAASSPPAPTSSPPDEAEPTDLASYMYQTVGHSVVPLYAHALSLPLYRRAITGSATQTSRSYDPTAPDASADETEDLTALLATVVAAHPAANAVCAGAILSTYQRTRIESVSLRLGLTPLAFLWQYPALPPAAGLRSRGESLTGLLDDMAAAGCAARIVKVASGGVEEAMLWADVTGAKTRRRLVQGMAPFFEGHEFWLRGAVLGEGGEYETLAVDGPGRVWRGGRIEFEGTDVVREEGGVCWVRAKGARVVKRSEESGEEGRDGDEDLVRVPGMFDRQFEAVLQRLQRWRREHAPVSHSQHLPDASRLSIADAAARSKSQELFSPHLPQLTLSTLSAATAQVSNIASYQRSSPAQQTENILKQLRIILPFFDPALAPTRILSTTLLLRSIDDFAAVNAAYAQLFPAGMPSPPARVAVACGRCLPRGMDVSLSVVLDRGDREKWRGLHVQGRSYWAPANIGAYGQAIAVGLACGGEKVEGVEVVHVAGQIPLVPATMEMYTGTFEQQATLALQHLWRVGQEREVDTWPWGVAFLDRAKGDTEVVQRVKTAGRVWTIAHEVGTRPAMEDNDEIEDDENAEELDAWDLKHNRSAGFGFDMSKVTVGEHLHLLPNMDIFFKDDKTSKDGGQTACPPLIVAEVEALPRGAPVEWHSLGLGGLSNSPARQERVVHRMIRRQWGTISWVRISRSDKSTEDERDENSEEDSESRPKRESAEVNFVTMMVFTKQKSQPIHGSSKIPKISNLLQEIFIQGPESSSSSTESTDALDDTTQPRISVVHSTSYVSSLTGWDAWEATGGEEAMPGTTLIPCWRVWDAAGSRVDQDPADGPGWENESSDGPSSAEPRELSMAVTMRVDVSRTS